jgi:hypothetical protein
LSKVVLNTITLTPHLDKTNSNYRINIAILWYYWTNKKTITNLKKNAMFIFELGNSFWLKSLPDKNVKARSDFHNKICCSVLCLWHLFCPWQWNFKMIRFRCFKVYFTTISITLQQITVIICVSSFIQMLSAT